MLRMLPLSVVVVAGLLLAGCGASPRAEVGDGEPEAVGTPDADGVLTVEGTDNLQWRPQALQAPEGEIAFELVCGDAVNHNLVVTEERELVAECGPGQRATARTQLAAGVYPYVCTIPGHESSMRGSLTVTATS